MGCAALRIVLATLFIPETTVFTNFSPKIAVDTVFTAFPMPLTTFCDFPYEHWARIRTNNVIERLNREIRRRTRVVGTFPDGNSALMLVCARLRHVAGTQWGNKKYMNMKHLEATLEDVSIAG